MTAEELWELSMFGTFAEAQFAIERKLAELGVPLEPRRLLFALADDHRNVTIAYPTQPGRFAISRFKLQHAGDIDAAAYVAKFECPLGVSH